MKGYPVLTFLISTFLGAIGFLMFMVVSNSILMFHDYKPKTALIGLLCFSLSYVLSTRSYYKLVKESDDGDCSD